MKAVDAQFYFDFDYPVTEDSVILCPDCNNLSALSEWVESTVGCDDCGEHVSIVCPECCEHFDHVFAKCFKVVDKSEI